MILPDTPNHKRTLLMKPAPRRARDPSVVKSIPSASVDSRSGRGRRLLLKGCCWSVCWLLLLAPLVVEGGMSGGRGIWREERGQESQSATCLPACFDRGLCGVDWIQGDRQ